MWIHRGETDGGLSEHRRSEVKLVRQDRSGWREVVALLRLRKHIRNIVPLVAPGIHVDRCEEDAVGSV